MSALNFEKPHRSQANINCVVSPCMIFGCVLFADKNGGILLVMWMRYVRCSLHGSNGIFSYNHKSARSPRTELHFEFIRKEADFRERRNIRQRKPTGNNTHTKVVIKLKLGLNRSTSKPSISYRLSRWTHSFQYLSEHNFSVLGSKRSEILCVINLNVSQRPQRITECWCCISIETFVSFRPIDKNRMYWEGCMIAMHRKGCCAHIKALLSNRSASQHILDNPEATSCGHVYGHPPQYAMAGVAPSVVHLRIRAVFEKHGKDIA